MRVWRHHGIGLPDEVNANTRCMALPDFRPGAPATNQVASRATWIVGPSTACSADGMGIVRRRFRWSSSNGVGDDRDLCDDITGEDDDSLRGGVDDRTRTAGWDDSLLLGVASTASRTSVTSSGRAEDEDPPVVVRAVGTASGSGGCGSSESSVQELARAWTSSRRSDQDHDSAGIRRAAAGSSACPGSLLSRCTAILLKASSIRPLSQALLSCLPSA